MALLGDVRTVGGMRGLSTLLLASLVLLLCTACALIRGRETEIPTTRLLPEVRRITFTGNSQFSSSTLLGEMVTKPRPFLQFWKRGEPYNSPTLQEDLLRIRKYYFDRGFLETTVHVERVQENAEENTVAIEIAIDEGPPTQVAEVRLTGSIPPALQPIQDIIAALPLSAGKRLNKADFDRSKEQLLTRLHNATYARAEIVPDTVEDKEAHTAEVTFELHPGTETTFGSITIEGERLEHDVLIRLNGQIEKRKKKLSKAVYGTSHLMSRAEAEYTYEKGVKHLIVGTGQYNNVTLSAEAADYFERHRCHVELFPTPKAIQAWNKTDGAVIGLFHVTC